MLHRSFFSTLNSNSTCVKCLEKKEGKGRIKRSCSFSSWWHMYHNRISLTHSTATWRKQFYSLALRQGINISLWISTQKYPIIAIDVDVISDSQKNVETNYNSTLATESMHLLKRCPTKHTSHKVIWSLSKFQKVKTCSFFSSYRSGCKYVSLSKYPALLRNV